MDLSGTWRAAPADEPLRRAYPQPTFDDSGWESIEVPGHWRSTPAFADHDGPLLLRRSFDHADVAGGQRAWLTFEGVFYQADVWLDGGYLGDAEGYFAPHAFEVTEALRDRREHVLAVEVTCPPQHPRQPRRNLTGAFQAVPPGWNPGGVWRPVRLHTTGQLAITRLRVLCLEATAERALLSFDATVDAATPIDAWMHTTISSGAGVDHAEAVRLSAGPNRVEWRVAVDAPSLWWPHALGEPELLDVEVAVVTPEGATSDRRRLRTGIRQVRMSSWVVAVNGERLFLKGANLGPSKLALGEAAPEELERDVAVAVEAGLDLLRLQAHVSRREVYEAADRHGLLLWQDLPIQAGLARHVRKEAVRQARQAVDLLGHHPSVALWCAHDEPVAADSAHVIRGRLAGLAVPTYNKTVLDGSLHRALHRADPSRPVVPHSGVVGRTDAHLWFGWGHGDERDLARFAANWPRAVRFVGAFGAASVPEADAFMGRFRWPDLDWERLAAEHGLDREVMARHGLDPGSFVSYDRWRDATQAHQASVVKHQIETLRRLKYAPTGGFAVSSFADGWPAVSTAVLDLDRGRKEAFYALVDACRPVIVVADQPDAAYAPADEMRLHVHVVSDLREPLADITVEARLEWTGGFRRWRWNGEVGADAVSHVGTIDISVPNAPGPLTCTLELRGADLAVTNRYDTRIATG